MNSSSLSGRHGHSDGAFRVTARAGGRVLAASLLGLAAAMAGGCSDGDAAARVEAQSTLAEATAKYQRLVGRSIDPGDAASLAGTRDELAGVASSVDALRSAGPGQSAAAALLAAHARLAIVDLLMVEAGAIRDEIDRQASDLRVAIEDLEHLAARRRAIRVLADALGEPLLEEDHQAARRMLAEARERTQALEEPIATLETEIDANQGRADELREQSQSLYRQATEAGWYRGLRDYRQAVDVQRAADRLDYQIGLAEADLAYQYRSPQSLARTEADGLRRLVESIEETRTGIDDLEREVRGELSELDSTLASSADAVVNEARQLGTMIEQRIGQTLGTAVTQAQEAARAAGRAASAGRDARSSAALEQSQAEARRGQVLWTHARILEQHANLLRDLAGIEAPGTDGLSADVDALMEQIGTLRSQAAEALEAARGHAANAGGGPASAAFLASLETAIAASRGERVTVGGGGGGMIGGGPGMGGSGQATEGFESAVAIVKALNTLSTSDFDGIMRLVNAIEPTSRETRILLDAGRSILGSAARFMQALATIESADGGTGGMLDMIRMQMESDAPVFRRAQIVDQGDGEATIEAIPAGESEPVTLEVVKLRGSWRIIADEAIFEGLGGMAGGGMPMPGSPGGPGGDESIEMVSQMAPMIVRMLDDVSRRIESGEISTEAELSAAMEQMMQQFMGGMGGMGGDPASGGPVGGGSPFGGGPIGGGPGK